MTSRAKAVFSYTTGTEATGLLTVCDTNTDSMRVIAELWDLTTGTLMARAEDANGNNGQCGSNFAWKISGHWYRLDVWAQNGAGQQTFHNYQTKEKYMN